MITRGVTTSVLSIVLLLSVGSAWAALTPISSITDLGVLSADNMKITHSQLAYNDISAPTHSWNDDGALDDGRFLHQYEFSVDESVANHVIQGGVKDRRTVFFGWEILDIDDMLVQLFSSTSELLFSGGNRERFELPLGEGAFYLNVSGIADGFLGGLYTAKLKVTDTVVPLPPAAILFLSALVGFGLIGRRKEGRETR